MWPSACGHRGRSTAVDLNTRVRGHLIVGQGVLLVHCLGAPSLLPRYSPSRAQRQMMPAVGRFVATNHTGFDVDRIHFVT